MAMAECTKMFLWLRRLLQELDCEQQQSTSITEDNQVAITWGNEGVRHAKHVSIEKHFVKEQVGFGSVRIVNCPTQDMTADALTKPLSRLSFQKRRDGLGVSKYTQ